MSETPAHTELPAENTSVLPAEPAPGNEDVIEGETHALEWHAPVLVRIDEHTTIPHLLAKRVQRAPRRPLIARKLEMGSTWQNMTAAEFYEDVQTTAAGLIGLGLNYRPRPMSPAAVVWTSS